MQINLGDSSITLIQGDISELAVDAIADFRNILPEQLGSVDKPGQGITAKDTISIISPSPPAVPDDRFLADTIQEILATAEKRGVRSIAVPAAYLEEMPPERVAKIMLTTALAFIRSGTSIHHVIFCMSDTASYSVFQKELERITS